MLKTKLPVANAPPKMSLFWSVPWPHQAWADKQKKDIEMASGRDHQTGSPGYNLEDLGGDCLWGVFGQEPRWAGARKIVYGGENIRVFPHEFSEVGNENMIKYVEESHYLIPDTVAEQEIVNEIRGGVKRVLYEEALLDGCSHREAVLTAMGVDVTGAYIVPAIGWYRIRPEYGLVFCTHEELNLEGKRGRITRNLKAEVASS